MKMPFGKWKGTEVSKLEFIAPSYIVWLHEKCDLKGELKDLVSEIYPRARREVKRSRRKVRRIDITDSLMDNSPIVSPKSDYNCGWGCTRYNPSCDACDCYTSVAESGRFFASDADKERAHRRSVSGLSPWGWGHDNDDSDEGDVGW